MKFFLQISLIKLILFIALFFAIGLCSSCDACKYASTYSTNSGTARGRMIYGHDNESTWTGFNHKNPYYVKAKKPAKTHNYYVSRW